MSEWKHSAECELALKIEIVFLALICSVWDFVSTISLLIRGSISDICLYKYDVYKYTICKYKTLKNLSIDH